MEFEAVDAAAIVVLCCLMVGTGLFAAVRDLLKGADLFKWTCDRGYRHGMGEKCLCPEPVIPEPPVPEFFNVRWVPEKEQKKITRTENNA